MNQIKPKFYHLSILLLFIFVPTLVLAAHHNSMTKEVTYEIDGKKMIGYLAVPKNVKPNSPAVLVVHEWWGQTDYPRKRALMLSEAGYIAMAVDMFGDRQITEHPKEARSFTKEVFSSAKNVRSRFDAAMKALVENSEAKPDNLVAIGYCFGGSVVLEMARQAVPLKGVASFHGGLSTPTMAQKGMIPTKILVLHGAADPMAKPEQIQAFHDEMKQAGADYRFIAYEDAKHGFTNPDADVYSKKLNFMVLGYNDKADQESWAEFMKFLGEL